MWHCIITIMLPFTTAAAVENVMQQHLPHALQQLKEALL